MTKAGLYYFTDSIFELELNLHSVRRELILMIEEFEKQDCLICFELKCRCSSKTAQYQNTSGRTSRIKHTNPDLSINNSKDIATRGPPADSLPKPKFEMEEVIGKPGASTPEKSVSRNIEVWLKKSKISQSTTDAQNEGQTRVPSVSSGTLKKAWSNGKLYDLNKEETMVRDEKVFIDPLYANTASAVEAFFKSFKVQQLNMTPANIAYIKNKLTAAYVQEKAKKTEYTYF